MSNVNSRVLLLLGSGFFASSAAADDPSPAPVSCEPQPGNPVVYVQVVGEGGKVLSRDPDRSHVQYMNNDKYSDGTVIKKCFSVPAPTGGGRMKIRASACLYKGAEREIESGEYSKPETPYRLTLRPVVKGAFNPAGDVVPLARLPAGDRKVVLQSIVDSVAAEPEAERKQRLDEAAAFVKARPGFFGKSLLVAKVRSNCSAECAAPSELDGEPKFVADWVMAKRSEISEEDSRERILYSVTLGPAKTPVQSAAVAILADGSTVTRLPQRQGTEWTSLRTRLKTAKDAPFGQYDEATLKAAVDLVRTEQLKQIRRVPDSRVGL